MRYRGDLLADARAANGLRVVLELEEEAVTLTTLTGERLGSWDILEVAVERADGDRFALTLGGEALVFAADDRLGFAYTGAPTIEKSRTRRSSGWKGKRRLKRLAAQTAPVQGMLRQPTPPADPTTPRAPSVPRPAAAPAPVEPAAIVETPPVVEDTPRPPTTRRETPATPPAAEEARQDREAVDEDTDAPLPAPSPEPSTARPTPRPVEAAESSGADPFGTEVVLDLAAPDDSLAVSPADIEELPVETPEANQEPSRGRLGILDRVRRQKVEHVHEYARTNLAGGLVRHVCAGCNHVSIGSIDDATAPPDTTG